MHEDRLGALIRRLAGNPGDEPFVLAVKGRPRFSPASVAFSSRRSLAVCLPTRAAMRLSASERSADAARRLAQGIGRGIRRPDGCCIVWLLDPRSPVPASMARAIGGSGQGQAIHHLEIIQCIRKRLGTGRRPAIDEGEIWPR